MKAVEVSAEDLIVEVGNPAKNKPQAQHIDGITGLKHRSVMTLIARKPQSAMVRGIEVTLEIDEQRFVAHSVAVFARAMER